MIDQMTEGHHFLKETFNVKPTISWQIDPFGASKVYPLLFQFMGFEYHIISRVDDRLKYVSRKKKKKKLIFSN